METSVTTVVRIKRPLGCDPPESIVMTKRRKIEGESSTDADVCTAVFMHLVEDKKNLPGTSLKKFLTERTNRLSDLKESFKKKTPINPKDIIRQNVKDATLASRYKIICAKRHLNETDDGKSEETSKGASAFDIQFFEALHEEDCSKALVPIVPLKGTETITCNGVRLKSEKEVVYDLYYTNIPDLHFSTWMDNFCEIRHQALALELVHNDEAPPTIEEIEEDDENAEENWRNDYPDEEDDLLNEDDDDFLANKMAKASMYDTDESYDEDDYNVLGDFDEEGATILSSSAFERHRPFKLIHTGTRGPPSDSGEEGGLQEEEEEE